MTEPTEPQSNPEFGAQMSDIEAFNAAYQDLQAHNKRFTLAGAVAGSAVRAMQTAFKAAELADEGLSMEEAIQTAQFLHEPEDIEQQQELERGVLGISHMDSFEAAGLTLSTLRKDGTSHETGSSKATGILNLQLVNGGRFVNFLHNAATLNPDDAFKRTITETIRQFTQEAYEFAEEDPSAVAASELMTYADGVEQAASDLGIAPSFRLKLLAEYAKQGIVSEYVTADKSHVLLAPAKDNDTQIYNTPSTWQRDSTAAYLEPMWEKVVSAVEKAARNPKARDFTLQILDRARAHLTFAQLDTMRIQEEIQTGTSYFRAGYCDGFADVFNAAAERLDAVEESLAL